MELWATQYIIFNVLWTKGPRIDFEIPVCLYENDVICKEKVHTQLVFSPESEEISMHMLFTTVPYNYYFLILLDFCFASCE